LESLLKLVELHKHFGGLRAVNGCNFSIQQGPITGLIGPNGAGKSTIFNLISGLIRSDSGQIYFNRRQINDMPPHEIARLGIARTFQIPRDLGEMTLMENLKLVPTDQFGEKLISLLGSRKRIKKEESMIEKRAWEVLNTVELASHASNRASILSVGQKKLLELARALMANPKLILLDEPAAGVNPRLMAQLLRVIQRLNAQETTFLIIEHNMDVIVRLCTHVIVMDYGKVLVEGSPEEIQQNEQVLNAYLGVQP
jgi:neutral amino acid transport system ATP-binding protein